MAERRFLRRHLRTLAPAGAIALLPLSAQPAWAQVGPKAIASADATATIVHPASVAHGYDLIFGLLKGGATAGSVTVRPEGLRAASGGAEMVGSGPCHVEYCEDDTSPSNIESASYWGPGQFEVTGEPGASYVVSAPIEVLAYYRTPAPGRTPTLVVGNFKFRAASTGLAAGTLDAAGRDSVRVGGTITIPIDMKTASYRVKLPINVQYD